MHAHTHKCAHTHMCLCAAETGEIVGLCIAFLDSRINHQSSTHASETDCPPSPPLSINRRALALDQRDPLLRGVDCEGAGRGQSIRSRLEQGRGHQSRPGVQGNQRAAPASCRAVPLPQVGQALGVFRPDRSRAAGDVPFVCWFV